MGGLVAEKTNKTGSETDDFTRLKKQTGLMVYRGISLIINIPPP